jgi:hypothetical protein
MPIETARVLIPRTFPGGRAITLSSGSTIMLDISDESGAGLISTVTIPVCV